MFHKILIANRGEIAVRIIRACRELGIETVAIYSEVDKKSLHVKLADEAHCIGKATSAESYLKYYDIVILAVKVGAQAIHPGYGYLSENAEFAELCKSSGIVFIGPSPDALRRMGDKAIARETMNQAHVPIPPGTKKPVQSIESAKRLAKKIGFPLLLKPSAGGGGKGMRIVNDPKELADSFVSSQTEAKAAFGSDDIYMERYITKARHIEFQILADNHGNAIHLGERECSVQRRHQKLVEEAPSPTIDPKLREKMGRAATKAAKSVNYSGAGTIEFLLTEKHKFYFIEMNTRIQVEHPVTECVTGIDIVKEQIRIAAGQELGLKQRDIKIRGHAIECRINAEDPQHDFMPSPGKIKGLGLPGGPGIRIDSHIYSGYEVPHFYDSLLAKLVAYAEDRETAIKRMQCALHEFTIKNVKTTIPFHEKIMNDRRFKSGEYDTDIVEKMKKDDHHHKMTGLMHKIMKSFHLVSDHH